MSTPRSPEARRRSISSYEGRRDGAVTASSARTASAALAAAGAGRPARRTTVPPRTPRPRSGRPPRPVEVEPEQGARRNRNASPRVQRRCPRLAGLAFPPARDRPRRASRRSRPRCARGETRAASACGACDGWPVDRQQPVAQQRDQVTQVARAPEEVLGMRHQHVVVCLRAEHEDGVVMKDLQREDRAEALVGVDQQARGSCSKWRVRAMLKLFSPGRTPCPCAVRRGRPAT